MIPVNLIETLTAHLRKLLADYSTEQPSGTFIVDVIPGRIPNPETAQENISAVYVIVRSVEDAGGNEMSSATVEMILSIYDEDDLTGWRTLYNVAEHIRQYLLKHRILDKKYMLKINTENPVRTVFVDDQPYPQWIATITAKYTISQPEEEGILYGR